MREIRARARQRVIVILKRFFFVSSLICVEYLLVRVRFTKQTIVMKYFQFANVD